LNLESLVGDVLAKTGLQESSVEQLLILLGTSFLSFGGFEF
jgi:hypothetical protein